MLLGIDLGTTNSLAAHFHDGRIELIPNALGHILTPSAVALDADGSLLVGMAARERMATDPARAVTAFKRWMGTERSVRLGKRDFRAEELSALVLQALRHDAEVFLGQPVADAVITVPAYFNQTQRKATLTAAELAGLRVERLLNEPTAAGLAYGLQERSEHSTFLVFDLGGGTFDVSVLEYFDGVVQVRSSAGDTRLGGEDFTRVLAELFLDQCADLSAGAKAELRQSGALWRAAEQAKRDLGEPGESALHEQAQAVIRVLHKEREYQVGVTRADFENASRELMMRLRRPIERALGDARLQPNELSEVVLVGGATRMPLIRQAVARLFQRLPLRTINPDETIVRGAAIQAGLMARHAALEDVVLTDVMPFSLGVVVKGDQFSPIIERNTPVPVSRMGRYQTIESQQTRVTLDIRQGESPVGTENLHLGDLEITVPALPVGEAGIDVRFSYDANGLLVVDCKVTPGGRTANRVIRQREGMSEAEVAKALENLQRLKVHPREEQDNRYLIERAKRLYEDRLGDERLAVQQWLGQFEAALDTQDGHIVAQARERFREALDSIDRGFLF